MDHLDAAAHEDFTPRLDRRMTIPPGRRVLDGAVNILTFFLITVHLGIMDKLRGKWDVP
jgi:hypothetical protein